MIDDNKVAIGNRMRRAEKQNQSPINRLLEGAESAQAFVQLRTPGYGSGAEVVVLLEDGARFYERLQEIGKEVEPRKQ